MFPNLILNDADDTLIISGGTKFAASIDYSAGGTLFFLGGTHDLTDANGADLHQAAFDLGRCVCHDHVRDLYPEVSATWQGSLAVRRASSATTCRWCCRCASAFFLTTASEELRIAPPSRRIGYRFIVVVAFARHHGHCRAAGQLAAGGFPGFVQRAGLKRLEGIGRQLPRQAAQRPRHN